MGPRLNAAGRLGQAQLGVELLTTVSSDRATALAEYLHELNNSRDSLERSIYLAAKKQLDEMFDAENDAAAGFGGSWLASGRDRYCRWPFGGKAPSTGGAHCPGRFGSEAGHWLGGGVPGFQVHEALTACTDWLITHGGHAAAGGLKILDNHVDSFRTTFCEFATAQIREEQRVAELWIDGETVLASLTLSAVEQIERLAPFGQGNHRPLLCRQQPAVGGTAQTDWQWASFVDAV